MEPTRTPAISTRPFLLTPLKLLKIADIYGAGNVCELWNNYKEGVAENIYPILIDKRKKILEVFINIDKDLDANLKNFISNSTKIEELRKSMKKDKFINFRKEKCINKIQFLINN